MTELRRAAADRIGPFDLRLFLGVLESGTITAAAQAASLSLAAASARLQALEHLVGTRLLERSKAGAAPTDAGRALARHARRVLAEMDTLHLAMAGYGRGLRGVVRLLGNTAALLEALPPRLGAFLVRHPDIDVELSELPSDAVLDALHRDVAEVGIVADHVDTSGLTAQPWIADELVALLPPARARAAPPLRYAELLAQPFVGLDADRGLSRFLVGMAARSGRVPQHRVRVGSFDALAQLVEAGVGVAVLPRSAAERCKGPRARLAPLADGWAHRRLLICTTERARAAPGVAGLVEHLLAA